jgi:hypothetical protein
MIGESFPAVLAAAQRGDERAFAVLWRKLQPAVLRYLRVAAPDAAEDLAADTWVSVIRGLARFRGDEPGFRALVFTAARHRALDWRRQASRTPSAAMPVEALDDRPAPDDPAEAALEAQSTRARPHGRAGRYRHWSSVSRCALGLLACSVLWPSGLVRRMRYSAALAERLVAYAVALQPAPFREHYQAMWLGDLDWLKTQDAPVLGWAVGMLSTATMTRLALRAKLAHTARHVRSLPQSLVARLISRHRPLGSGLLTAAGVFCAAAAGWSGVGQGPSRTQMLWALAASVLTGGAVTWQAWPRGPVPEERDPVEKPDRPARW